jgi:hypothetical protein
VYFCKKIEKMGVAIEKMDFKTIQKLYPEQWVLIGNPEMIDSLLQASFRSNFKCGIVVLHSKDRFEIAHQAKNVRDRYTTITLAFTGELPKNRKIWL